MNITEIVNLTPHRLDFMTPDGVRVIEPSVPRGSEPRVASTTEVVGRFEGIELTVTTFGEVENLPAPRDGVLLVVSGMVRSAVTYRDDLASPGSPVRDAEGRVIGAQGLILNARP